MKQLGLSNKNASKEAILLYNYICSVYKKKIISGQQEDPRIENCENEIQYIQKITGKTPAIRGLDYIHSDFDSVNKRAVNWWKKGGIVTICWHWGIPPDGIGYPSSQETIDLYEALDPSTDLHKGMLRQMDEVAAALKELERQNIPVLWRPLHEFDGGWFWWGKGGPEAFISLWRLMYHRFTDYHKLNNLIWVLGYSGEIKDGWFPGNDVYDIIGSDIYAEGIHTDLFQKIVSITGDKVPICYHENGPLPDPVLLQKNSVFWSWFMTWHTIHIMEQNSPDFLKKVYLDPYVLTLEDLPKWI